MTKDEAIHKALKVLNCLNNDRVYETAWVKGAINACEEALEQEHNFCSRCGKRASKDPNHIHTCTPPQALEQPAQDYGDWFPQPMKITGKRNSGYFYAEGWNDCLNECWDAYDRYKDCPIEQPAQEPVAWMYKKDEKTFYYDYRDASLVLQYGYIETPLYTHPHQWQGLTDDEILRLLKRPEFHLEQIDLIDFARAIEQALRNKNG